MPTYSVSEPGKNGSRAWTTGVDCTTAASSSRQMLKLNQATHWMATKFSSSVVMISFTCQCARASAGTRIHTAPATAAATAITTSSRYRGPAQWMPMPVAAQAPMKNWPSEPMFQIFMRRAMCTASAFIMIGVSSSAISSMPWRSRNVPSTDFHSRLSGLRPVRARMTAATTSPASTPPTRASAAWLGVTLSRRSRRRGITRPRARRRTNDRPSAVRAAHDRRGAGRTRRRRGLRTSRRCGR